MKSKMIKKDNDLGFMKYNHNPNQKKTGDCVIRAIGKALNLSWEHTFEDLVRISREIKSVPNFKDTYHEYLKLYSKINVKYESDMGIKRYTVEDICKWSGSYIISIANHLTCVVDGVCYDTWDCRKKSAYIIWKIR